ncbi:hypothetical protein [Maridesulfovibrio hydrothermalis]|uniref:Uncharacterized protein n=1 Tax=Maridesulfovibrio hydrothermalis AM13 = DSM 14728 TaxID=1121451 RepID=L0RHG9_9BACT|nr:hypothetical protein [Maridesulfovibrio hydrothermalis]CCO25016.1 conserved protein of unknown function [Maridesulfovibrio hydrothermalis AM13 = DSM 14728]
MSDDDRQLQDLLIRIDERVKSIQEDISEINGARRCHTHAEKFRNLERAVWGTAAVVAGVATRVAYEAFK